MDSPDSDGFPEFRFAASATVSMPLDRAADECHCSPE
jgi:hypothetical protein